MTLTDKEFFAICINHSIHIPLHTIPIEHFLYAVSKYFDEKKVIKNFEVPENIINRLEIIKSQQAIDFQSVNSILKIDDQNITNTIVNKELEDYIIKGMPENLSEIEKALYIYIKMCKTLTYDEEYFAVNQKGPAITKHKSLTHVTEITPESNQVVCYEFNVIYARLLENFGINSKRNCESIIVDGEYGVGHESLDFRVGKYLVTADSVTSILYGDLPRAKLNQPLEGIKCNNKNEQTQNDFNNALSRMYKLIQEQESTIQSNSGSNPTLEETIKEYLSITANLKEIGLDEKLGILISKVNSTKMVGVDLLSYVLKLRKILFSKDELENKVQVTIVRNNELPDSNRLAAPVAIFAINKDGLAIDNDNTTYYYYNPNCDLNLISREKLQEKFESQSLAYIDDKPQRIPGITESEGIRI